MWEASLMSPQSGIHSTPGLCVLQGNLGSPGVKVVSFLLKWQKWFGVSWFIIIFIFNLILFSNLYLDGNFEISSAL